MKFSIGTPIVRRGNPSSLTELALSSSSPAAAVSNSSGSSWWKPHTWLQSSNETNVINEYGMVSSSSLKSNVQPHGGMEKDGAEQWRHGVALGDRTSNVVSVSDGIDDTLDGKSNTNIGDVEAGYKNHWQEKTEYQLNTIAESPRFLHRAYIASGYRVHFSYSLCAKSIFRLHNETGNIWTHLLGLALFVWVLIDESTSATAVLSTLQNFDRIPLLFFYITSIVCFVSSCLYHTGNCHAPQTYSLLYKCDLFGISSMILGSYLPGLYHGFTCFPPIQLLYCTVVSFLVITSMIVPHLDRCQKPEFHAYRVALLVSVIVFAIVPAAHWVYCSPAHIISHNLPSLIKMFAWYIAGFVFYIFHLPERWSPGTFDIWIHSHQLWHICIVMAAWTWHDGLTRLITSQAETPCSEYTTIPT
jgi:predicted membrane channel-forming protein YqfA (hemolysin III family)